MFGRTKMISREMAATGSQSSNGSLSDYSDEDSGGEKMTLEFIQDQYSEVCFGNLANLVASNYGRAPQTRTQEDMEEAWHADSWDDCQFHLGQFVLTYIYEVLPPLFSGFLCWLVEGKTAANNRDLLFPGGGGINFYIISSWAIVFIYAYWSPPGSSLCQSLVILLLVSFRAASIGMKYAYFPESNLRLMLHTENWKRFDHLWRTLGGSVHFNFVKTFEFDVMMEMSLAALRADVFKELPRQAFTCTKANAARFWETVKAHLSKFEDDEHLIGKFGNPSLDTMGLRASKFGDMQSFIGLSDTDKIEQEISQGKLRSSIVAYYFALEEYKPCPCGVCGLVPLAALVVVAVKPVVRYAFEDTSEDTWLTHVYQILFALTMLMNSAIFLLYVVYCVLDAWKRNQLCRAVLASIGHRQIRGERLLERREDIFLPLCSPEDMMAFWVVQRVLGPELYRGQSIRYNCAYLTITLVHLLGMFLLVLISSYREGLDYSIAAQILLLFLLGVILVMAATMLAAKANYAVTLVRKVLARASLNSMLRRDARHCEIVGLVDVLNANFEDVLPIQIFYLPATGEVVSLIWTSLLFFIHIMLKELSEQLHVPGLILDLV